MVRPIVPCQRHLALPPIIRQVTANLNLPLGKFPGACPVLRKLDNESGYEQLTMLLIRFMLRWKEMDLGLRSL